MVAAAPRIGFVMSDAPSSAVWSIYLVRMANGHLYTGITVDVARRFAQHQQGKGAKALRGKGPLNLVWQQTVIDKNQALRLEYRLKQQSKSFKEQLIAEPKHWCAWLSQLQEEVNNDRSS